MGAAEESLEPSALKEGMKVTWLPPAARSALGATGMPAGTRLLSSMVMVGSALGNPFICSQIFCVPPWSPAVSPDCSGGAGGSAKAWSGASAAPLRALVGDGGGTSGAAKSRCPCPGRRSALTAYCSWHWNKRDGVKVGLVLAFPCPSITP